MRRKKTLTLKEVRIKAGLTILELAKKSELTWGTVQAIESERTPGTLMAKVKLAGALGMDFKELWPETYTNLPEPMKRTFFLSTSAQKEK